MKYIARFFFLHFSRKAFQVPDATLLRTFKTAACFLLILFPVLLSAQQKWQTIEKQNFTGVKNMRIYRSEADTGARMGNSRHLVRVRYFNTSGKPVLDSTFLPGGNITVETYAYDSAGRIILSETRGGSGGKTTYRSIYSSDSSGHVTIRHTYRNDTLVAKEKKYWSATENVEVSLVWSRDTSGIPVNREHRDKNGRLLKRTYYDRKFEEYIYDSLGYFIGEKETEVDKAGTPYTETWYTTNKYGNGRLVEWSTNVVVCTLKYDPRGMIIYQCWDSEFEDAEISEVEYVYW